MYARWHTDRALSYSAENKCPADLLQPTIKLLTVNCCFVNYSPLRFLRHVFEMPSRCVRDVDLRFVNVFAMQKNNHSCKYANIHIQLPSPGRGWGWASSFAWTEMKKRMYSGATAKV